jgi:arginase
MPFVCIGVPYWLGERQTNSPVDVVKRSGIADELHTVWVDIQPDFDRYDNPVVAVNRALADAISAHADHTPLIFAADCTSALGAMKGLESKHPAVLWYDAHGDFNTEETTPSGFLGGMPLAAMVGRGNESLMQGIDLRPVPEDDVFITDARDLDPEEGQNLAASRVTHYQKVDDLLTAPLPSKPLYIHFDTDVVDSDEMPAMNYPTQGGPSMAQTLATVERVAADAEIAGALFSLWNQDKEGAPRALENTLEVVRVVAAKGGA